MNLVRPSLKLISILVLSILSASSCTDKKAKEPQKGTTYKLYFAGGQSNMEGYGYVNELPREYQNTVDNVMIFDGNQLPDVSTGGGLGQWRPLSGGFGAQYTATKDSVFLSDRFGPELSFGKHIASLTGDNIAIVKYARGGTALALDVGYGSWYKEYKKNTTINQWDHFENTIANAYKQKDIDGDGVEDILIPSGIIWMQGEADAYDESAAKSYYENLNKIMKDLPLVISEKKLPIVMCRIEDSGMKVEDRVMPHIEHVWDAQEKFANENDHVTLIKLDQPVGFLEDKWHYKSKHYIEMGKKFAEALK